MKTCAIADSLQLAQQQPLPITRPLARAASGGGRTGPTWNAAATPATARAAG